MSSHGETDDVVLIGPVHPYTGGISQHNTRLALELQQRGVALRVESWRHQYPKALRPGLSRVPADKPEIGQPASVKEKLRWYSPLSWWLAGIRSRKARVIAATIPTPFHFVPYLVLLAAAGRRAKRIGIVHNVLPHEPGPTDTVLMRWLLSLFDRLVVHDERAKDLAVSLGVPRQKITVLELPSPWKSSSKKDGVPEGSLTRLLFFGAVRHYKGVDLLIRALAEVSQASLTVAGEFWDGTEAFIDLIDELDLGPRVTLLPGYVESADFRSLFSQHHVLVLPYRTGTGSIVGDLASQFGLPVIATDVGSIASGIEQNKTGLVIPANNHGALVDALIQASDPVTLRSWTRNVEDNQVTQSTRWEQYCLVFTSEDPESSERGENR